MSALAFDSVKNTGTTIGKKRTNARILAPGWWLEIPLNGHESGLIGLFLLVSSAPQESRLDLTDSEVNISIHSPV